MLRRTTRALALLLLATPLVTLAAPSQAATTTLGDLDSTTAGHVTGTVTTDAPYVRLRVVASDGTLAHESDVLPVSAGQLGFDLPTWGVGACTVRALPCTDATTCATSGAVSP